MKPFKNILVGLDTSDLDTVLIKYTSFLVDHTSAKKIYFVNLVKNLHIPSNIQKEFPNIIESAIKERKNQLENTIKNYYLPEKKIDVNVVVQKGMSGDLLSLASEYDIDLIIVGKKDKLKGSGITSKRLARRASCNLLIVPENFIPNARRILVPIDFSKYSKLALEQCFDFCVKNDGKPEVFCQHVYSVPNGYHYTGKSYDDFDKIMKKNARSDFDAFMKNIDTREIKFHSEYTLDSNGDVHHSINQYAKKLNPDFIIIGAKGRTTTTSLLLGSLTEKMVSEDVLFPLLIIRFKGQNASLLEILRNI